MDRIQKVSCFFLYALKFLVVFLPLFAVLKWMVVDAQFMHTHLFPGVFLLDAHNGKLLSTFAWTPVTKLIGLSAYLLNLLPIWLSLWALIGLFKNYMQAKIFSAANARYYRQIGWMFIFYALAVKPIFGALMSLATTLNNPPGERVVSVSFGTPNMEALFCGTVVIIISWVMLEASKLHDDLKLTV